MRSKSNLFRKTFYYDREQYKILQKRLEGTGIKPSQRIRQLIEQDNLKPFLTDFEYSTSNSTQDIKTRARDTLKEE